MSLDLTRRKFIATGSAAATLPFLGIDASAQAWPSRPIKIVAGYPAGGQTDLFARTYGDFIAKQLGQPVLVENKAGAGGTVAAVDVKRAPPDGYTLMFTISTTMIMNRALMKNLAYDADKDFQLISIMPAGSLPLVVSPKTGAKTLAEFVDYARKNPKVSLGTYAAGSFAHMVVAELNRQYGLRMEPVHYRGEAPMWTDLANQTIDAASGQLRCVARDHSERPRHSGCGLAQAHAHASQRADVPGAGRELAGLPPDRLPVLCRSQSHADGDHQAAQPDSGRGRQRARRCRT